MTTQTLTLADFLLARIADDEERARFVYSQHDDWARSQAFEPWRLSWQDEYDLLCIEPPRALAECEAKRRIVEPARDVLSTRGAYASYADDTMLDGMALTYQAVLRVLAQPYADHPDFRREWLVAPNLPHGSMDKNGR